MKRMAALLLALLLVLSLAACGGAPASVQDDAAKKHSAEETQDSQTGEEPSLEAQLPEDGVYDSKEEVALYIHLYGHLPDNYITKNEAQDAGWVSQKGNLWDVAYGMSIGGDRYGNYDGQLPKGEKYYEADVNYDGGYRGEERIVYTEDGDVWYTSDHYESFEKLY